MKFYSSALSSWVSPSSWLLARIALANTWSQLHITGSPALSALPHTNNNEDPMNEHDQHQHHHQVVRSIHYADDEKAPPKQDDVACCG
ncbi:uncharacterized protein LOC128258345 [Drosophila gunungcola]|uniref:Uncharacterized protein n=1 Tax=Drosophila gunungcola TaxID=103775 RepID=A0A9P9YPG9_9MUSC|nr:uncharacterized protein LOC128258345 [Drosophila gunungcola]KAI8040662.1 hypothetical protein M5D96_006605 [Drosophila gunungcola]